MEVQYGKDTLFRQFARAATFICVCLFSASCGILSYPDSVHVIPKHIVLTQSWDKVPDDSLMTFPLIFPQDTSFYKMFDDILYLNTYLSHFKYGEKTWYEVNVSSAFDTVNIDIYARQYTIDNSIRTSHFDGVILYKDNFFLTRVDSTLQQQMINRINDSIIINWANPGGIIYYNVDYNNNFPEYAYMKYVYKNDSLEKRHVEINNTTFSLQK